MVQFFDSIVFKHISHDCVGETNVLIILPIWINSHVGNYCVRRTTNQYSYAPPSWCLQSVVSQDPLTCSLRHSRRSHPKKKKDNGPAWVTDILIRLEMVVSHSKTTTKRKIARSAKYLLQLRLRIWQPRRTLLGFGFFPSPTTQTRRRSTSGAYSI